MEILDVFGGLKLKKANAEDERIGDCGEKKRSGLKMDRIINAISKDGYVRLILADTTETVNEAEKYHNTTSTTTALLGRLLTAASIMGSDLKHENFPSR